MPARMKLSSVYSTLPPAEKKVADFILANPDEAAHMVINEIAHRAGVSVPSVTRLARKLGYSGFMDFRVSLASSSVDNSAPELQPLLAEDTDAELFRKLLLGQAAAISSTLKAVDLDSVAALADRVITSGRVVWFAVGSCTQIVRTVSDGLCRLGIDSVVVENRGIMRSYAACLGDGDLVFAVTRTGKTPLTLDCLRIAKEHGAATALISNLVNSPGKAYADHFIFTSRQDELYRVCGYETSSSICALLESFLILVERKKGFGQGTQNPWA